MSYSALIESIEAALEASPPGLTATPDQREQSLLNVSRGGFDGSYLLRLDGGVQPWPDTSTNPRHWRGVLVVEVATELTTSLIEQSKTMETRGRQTMEALIDYSNTITTGSIYEWSEPTVQRAFAYDKRLVWSVRLNIRWTDD